MKGLHSLRIALIADELTTAALAMEAQVLPVMPHDPPWRLRRLRPDFLFVESAWRANGGRWKFRIASYDKHPLRSNRALRRLVRRARGLGIPTVFWNKEDPVHFDRFIDSARLFDHVFTVDADCVPKYRKALKEQGGVHVLPFVVQHRIHHPQRAPAETLIPRAGFVGSWHAHRHPQRRALQRMLFAAASRHLGLDVHDRNSWHKWEAFRYPSDIPMNIHPAVPHEETARLYRRYLVNLNVNTVLDSPTMYSRRLVEILACGGLAATTPSLAVSRLFADFCHVVENEEQADALFERLARDGLSRRDREMALAGSEHVLRHYTWSKALQDIVSAIGL